MTFQFFYLQFRFLGKYVLMGFPSQSENKWYSFCSRIEDKMNRDLRWIFKNYNFNGIINGLPLEKYVAATGLGRHGPHKRYTDQIRDAINRWSAINQNFDGPKAKKILKDLVNGSADYVGIKNRINSTSGRINLLDLEIPF